MNLPAAREKGERNQLTSKAPIPPTRLSPLEIDYGCFFFTIFFFPMLGMNPVLRHARHSPATRLHRQPPLPPPLLSITFFFFLVEKKNTSEKYDALAQEK